MSSIGDKDCAKRQIIYFREGNFYGSDMSVTSMEFVHFVIGLYFDLFDMILARIIAEIERKQTRPSLVY